MALKSALALRSGECENVQSRKALSCLAEAIGGRVAAAATVPDRNGHRLFSKRKLGMIFSEVEGQLMSALKENSWEIWGVGAGGGRGRERIGKVLKPWQRNKCI